MGNRCRVTFYDLQQEMRRSIEVRANSPMSAAEAALRWMLEQDLVVEDFGQTVKVEVITTVEHFFHLTVVASRLSRLNEQASTARAA
jgi:hypothetical protein